MTKNKVFITGAGGFIGSHLTELCVESGLQTKALVHYNSNNNWGWLELSPYKNDIEIIMGDVRDSDLLNYAMKDCHTVFHLAALIAIPYSYISPLAFIRTNIEGTYNILQAAKSFNYENILITSTSETYGSAQYIPIDEAHPMVGQSPYSASKIAADQLAISYYRSYELPIKIVRPFNTYGPRQSARAIIPTIITQILAGANHIKVGNIQPTRDFTFVNDITKGFLAIAESDSLFGEITNIGSKKEISIRDLIESIKKKLNSNIKIEIDTTRIRPKKSEVDRLFCENSKIRQHTDWNISYDLDRGLAETIAWFKQNKQYYKATIYNI